MAIPARTTDDDGVIEALTTAQQIQVKTERLDVIRKALLNINTAGVTGAQFGQRQATFLDPVALRREENRLVDELNRLRGTPQGFRIEVVPMGEAEEDEDDG